MAAAYIRRKFLRGGDLRCDDFRESSAMRLGHRHRVVMAMSADVERADKHSTYGGYLASGLVFGLVFLCTRSILAAVALHALNNLWVELNWQVRADYDAAPILGLPCSPCPP